MQLQKISKTRAINAQLKNVKTTEIIHHRSDKIDSMESMMKHPTTEGNDYKERIDSI